MKKSIFDRGVKLLTGIATVLFLFVLAARFESHVHAQSCAPTIRIDVAGCIWDQVMSTCSHFFVPGTIVACNTTSCRTIPNVCSSNDPCIGNSAATCQISGCSPGYCSVTSTPTPPGATPGPPSGSCDGCSDAGSCSGKAGSWSASSASNHPECAAAGGYCSGTSNCGGGPGGTPPPGNLSCGAACSDSSQCRNPSPANVPTACINGTCQSTMCPANMTIPGANCSCGANSRQCGQTCNAAIGLCAPGQGSCTYVGAGPDCPWGYNNFYCAGAQNGYQHPRCATGDTGGAYLVGPTGKTRGFTVPEIAASCQVCGDGIKVVPEQCDDGALNGTAGSNCTSACQTFTLSLTANNTADNVSVPSGSNVTLDWKSLGLSNLVASDGWSGSKTDSGSQVINNVTANTTFTITGTQDSTGLPVTASVNVNVIGQPLAANISLSVNNISAPVVYVKPMSWAGYWAGTDVFSNSQFRWNVTNVGPRGCVGSTLENACGIYPFPSACPYVWSAAVAGWFLWSWPKAASGTGWVPIPNDAGFLQYGTFRLTCQGLDGQDRHKDILVSALNPSTACVRPVPRDPGSGICSMGAGIPQTTDWTWPAVPGVTSYDFRIDDTAGVNRIAPRVVMANTACTAGVCKVTVLLNPGLTYRSVVSNRTGSCTINPAPQTSPPFTLTVCLATVTSTVQTDTTNGAKIVGGACSVGGAAAYTLGGTVTATKIPSPPGAVYSGPVNGAGVYTINSVPYSANPIGYNLTFVPPAGYFVTCPASGTYSNVTVPNVPVLPFFVSPVAENWFQTKGGDVAGLGASGTTAVNDPIPVAFCAGSLCEPFFSLPLLPARQDTVGLLFTMSGSNVDLNNSAGSQTGNVGSPSRLVATGTAPVLKESYDYFWRLFSMGLTSTTDLGQAGNSISDAREPNPPPTNGSAYYAAGNMTIESNNWNVTGNKNKVIFVNGDLTIKNEIKVDNGSFLAFIVKRDIIIDPSVGTLNFAQTTDGQVQGVYFAGRDILVGTVNNIGVEKKFIGEGTFAAKGAIKLLRDYRNGLVNTNGPMNNQQPASLVIYRPDFLINAPAKMKSPTFTWKEINP